MTYTDVQRAKAAAWKAATRSIPDEARSPAPYTGKDGRSEGAAFDFCLPREYAVYSLLPEVRGLALDLFSDLGIPWHAEVDRGPSNHLLSSQVQCVNALGQMVLDYERVKRAFADFLEIDEVLEIEPGRYLTFEYIGPADFFGEAAGGRRIRGARCTSVDAAFKYRATDGSIELVLVEWKYTESYRRRAPDSQGDAVRLARYGDALADPSGPINGEVLPFGLLLDEPFYQLVRQQLLAQALEMTHAEDADRVRVLHVLPPDNTAYQASLHRPEHRALGSTVGEVWQQLLRHPDRFMSLDSALFLDPDITSREYVVRYADDVIYDEPALMSAFGVANALELEDALDFHGDVALEQGSVNLVIGTEGLGLDYPFRAIELVRLADELAEGDG